MNALTLPSPGSHDIRRGKQGDILLLNNDLIGHIYFIYFAGNP